jgi:hypothetical protein
MPVRDKLVHLFPIVYNYSIGSDHFQPKAYPAVCGGSLLRMQGRGSGAETHRPPIWKGTETRFGVFPSFCLPASANTNRDEKAYAASGQTRALYH